MTSRCSGSPGEGRPAMLLPLLLLPLLFLLVSPAQSPPPELDPYSASEEPDEMDPEPAEGGGGPWRGTEALIDFPPRGRRRKRELAFLEHAPHRVPIQHRRVAVAMAPPEECDCPETLAKGTMVAIVSVLAFLGFFSTSVLLVVAICLLRMVDRQRKSGKDANGASIAKRPLPPLPRTPDGAYLSPDELNPGPSPAPEKTYSGAGKIRPGAEGEIYGTPEGTKPERSGQASPIAETPVSGRENHIYEEVE